MSYLLGTIPTSCIFLLQPHFLINMGLKFIQRTDLLFVSYLVADSLLLALHACFNTYRWNPSNLMIYSTRPWLMPEQSFVTLHLRSVFIFFLPSWLNIFLMISPTQLISGPHCILASYLWFTMETRRQASTRCPVTITFFDLGDMTASPTPQTSKFIVNMYKCSSCFNRNNIHIICHQERVLSEWRATSAYLWFYWVFLTLSVWMLSQLQVNILNLPHLYWSFLFSSSSSFWWSLYFQEPEGCMDIIKVIKFQRFPSWYYTNLMLQI